MFHSSMPGHGASTQSSSSLSLFPYGAQSNLHSTWNPQCSSEARSGTYLDSSPHCPRAPRRLGRGLSGLGIMGCPINVPSPPSPLGLAHHVRCGGWTWS